MKNVHRNSLFINKFSLPDPPGAYLKNSTIIILMATKSKPYIFKGFLYL